MDTMASSNQETINLIQSNNLQDILNDALTLDVQSAVEDLVDSVEDILDGNNVISACVLNKLIELVISSESRLQRNDLASDSESLVDFVVTQTNIIEDVDMIETLYTDAPRLAMTVAPARTTSLVDLQDDLALSDASSDDEVIPDFSKVDLTTTVPSECTISRLLTSNILDAVEEIESKNAVEEIERDNIVEDVTHNENVSVETERVLFELLDQVAPDFSDEGLLRSVYHTLDRLLCEVDDNCRTFDLQQLSCSTEPPKRRSSSGKVLLKCGKCARYFPSRVVLAKHLRRHKMLTSSKVRANKVSSLFEILVYSVHTFILYLEFSFISSMENLMI